MTDKHDSYPFGPATPLDTTYQWREGQLAPAEARGCERCVGRRKGDGDARVGCKAVRRLPDITR